MEDWVSDIQFERIGPLGKAAKKLVVNPLANYMPASVMRWVLRATRSELAAANWADPGGWESMVISYDGRPKQWADKVLVGSGSIPVALRNRRVLAGRMLARLIDQCPRSPAEVLCVGAGPAQIIMDAMAQAKADCRATLVDISGAAHEYARSSAKDRGLDGRMRFVTGDIRHFDSLLGGYRPDIVKMIGICEYLGDEQIVGIAKALAAVMAPGAPIVLNSLTHKHGTDRFFRRVFGLHMIHRGDRHLQNLLGVAGFGSFESVPEPMGVYHVIATRRQA
jgi:hypothetical protein